jgi:DNA-binding NarL/FixJ family response regulator
MAKTDPTLTKRERDILLLIRLGKTNKEVAQELDVSVNTVKTHLKNLFAKLEVHNRTQATIKAESIINSTR